jgi:uncharacterized membrane protein
VAEQKQRFDFIDQFRGLVGVMMALGHSNYYFNNVWLSLDPLDPFFGTPGQFWLRYMGYLCAPGFLMMNGAMVYYAYWRRVHKGMGDWRARWDFVQRGLFLIAVQIVWVNASWSGFARLRLDHFGIIATIGTSMLLLILIVRWRWRWRLAVAAALFLVHPLLLRIPYDHGSWTHVPMQLFVDAGDYNKYPVLPWFALAVIGSVMAHFWFEVWRDPAVRANRTMGVGLALVLAAWALRWWGGDYANIFPHGEFLSWAFCLVQKYPPSLAHQLWFAGAVIFMVGLFCRIGMYSGVLKPLAVVGRVPMFFYAVHIPLLAVFTRRLGIYYREGEVLASFVGLAGLLCVMIPLAVWFGGVKRRSRNWFIRMI